MSIINRSDISASIRVTAGVVVLTGLVFPAVIWGIAQVVMPFKANGSLLKRADGTIIGSELIGQPFTAPKYFHPRPSAAGSGYDGGSSGGTNLGPTSSKLFEGIADDPATAETDESYAGVKTLAAAYRSENGLAENAPVPVDAVTRSGSGLDPHISLANAKIQSARVARARGIDRASVEKLVAEHSAPPFLRIFGDHGVNVLTLNLALDSVQVQR